MDKPTTSTADRLNEITISRDLMSGHDIVASEHLTVDIAEGDMTDDFFGALIGQLDEEAIKTGDAVPEMISVDLETGPCDFDEDRYWEDTPVALATVYSPGLNHAQLIRLHETPDEDPPEQFQRLMGSAYFLTLFHHAMFDGRFILSHYGSVPMIMRCTKILSKIAGTPATKPGPSGQEVPSNSLVDLLGYFQINRGREDMDKSLALSDWFADELSDEQVRYALQDVVHLPALRAKLKAMIERRAQDTAAEESNPDWAGFALPVMANGMQNALPSAIMHECLGGETGSLFRY